MKLKIKNGEKYFKLIFVISVFILALTWAIIMPNDSAPDEHMKILKDKELLKGKILDFACGHGEDVSILSGLGFDIIGYDKFNNTYRNDKLLINKYDVVTCNYCFNVIPNLEEQNRIVSILDRFDTLCNDISVGLPAEIESRKRQYEYYRDKLLTFDAI